jgi:hypothetical protein
MTETSPSADVGSAPRREYTASGKAPTAWVGWIMFASTMMIVIGLFHAIQGLVAIFKDDYFLVADSGLVVTLDYTAWGWLHLLGGLLVAFAGVSLYSGRMWARVVGIALAVISALLNFAMIAAYPLWSMIIIALDVFVILALTVHGREMQSL